MTAPDATRRTYAYDDDWRVTRHYDPDVVPTVAAFGELRDLEDDFVGPNRTYALTVAADQPDGAGLRRLLVELSNGTGVEGEGVPCTTTPYDVVCPTQRTTNLDVGFSDVPEGEQTIRAAADDDEQHHATSDAWNVVVDKTPPSAAADFELSHFDPSDPAASATITWSAPHDPDLPGGIPGSGVIRTETRYRVGSGAFTNWIASDTDLTNEQGHDEVSDGDLAFFGGTDGDAVTVEVRATDAVGNVSAAASGTVTLAEQREDPNVEALINAYFADEYGMTESVGSAWQKVIQRSVGLGAQVSAALPPLTYGGIWKDNATRRIKIGVTTGTDHGSVLAVINQFGLQAHTDIVEVQHTQGRLEQGLVEIGDALESLDGQGLYSMGRVTPLNRIEIDVAASASPSQRAQIQAAADAVPATVAIFDVPNSTVGIDLFSCDKHACDGPLRGGVPLRRETQAMVDGCTTGFVAHGRDVGRTPRVFTAGHCLRTNALLAHGTQSPNQGVWQEIGLRASPPVFGSGGDAGVVNINLLSRYGAAAQRRPIVYVRDSGSTTKRTNYPIRGTVSSDHGDPVCVSGARTGTTLCGEVDKLGDKLDVDGVTIRGLGRIKGGCDNDVGDSGGPVFRGHNAFGLLIGGGGSVRIGPFAVGCRRWFQGIRGAQERLVTDVAVRR